MYCWGKVCKALRLTGPVVAVGRKRTLWPLFRDNPHLTEWRKTDTTPQDVSEVAGEDCSRAESTVGQVQGEAEEISPGRRTGAAFVALWIVGFCER